MKRLASPAFAIVEILIAITILSIALLGIISGVSSGIVAISGNKNITKAMIIAKSRLNEFMMLNFRGADIQAESVREYPGFTFSRKITRFDSELFGPISARRVEMTVTWEERGIKKNYSISYVFQEK
jgi:type II secretory pathway pseudopilin PulG